MSSGHQPGEPFRRIRQREKPGKSKKQKIGCMGCRGCALGILQLAIVIFLVALFWPVKKEVVKPKPKLPPYAFKVDGVDITPLPQNLLEENWLKKLKKGDYYIARMKITNGPRDMAFLDYGNFKLIVEERNAAHHFIPHRGTGPLYSRYGKKSPWGEPFKANTKMEIMALYLLPWGSSPKFMRVHSADMQSEKFEDISVSFTKSTNRRKIRTKSGG